MNTRCAIPRCRAEPVIEYLGQGLCVRHWSTLADAPDYSEIEAATLAALGLKRNEHGEVEATGQ